MTFARYGLVVASQGAGPSGAVRAVKAANPSTKVIMYANATSHRAGRILARWPFIAVGG